VNNSAPAAVGSTTAATFHLHPLRRCNLACRHCYSHSSPYESEMLGREEALAAIVQASAWGYTRLAVSGGEPLLYPWLGDCLAVAAGLGMETAVITNGLLLARAENRRVLRQADVVGVSVDGLDGSHNAIRGHARAFSHVIDGLAQLADADIGFGIVCGVCTANLCDIDALADVAWRAGARSVQFHPITQAGRAAEQMKDASLSDDDSKLLYVASALLGQEYEGRLRVHTDLMHRRQLLRHPGVVYGTAAPEGYRQALPAALLGMLVMEPDATLNPVSFGFAPRYRIGNARQASLQALWSGWLDGPYAQLLALGRRVVEAALNGALPDVFNPNEILFSHAQRAAAPVRWVSRSEPDALAWPAP
jgi:MoaA/NifB/PqqE/SkfB family radical SAM enzyme